MQESKISCLSATASGNCHSTEALPQACLLGAWNVGGLLRSWRSTQYTSQRKERHADKDNESDECAGHFPDPQILPLCGKVSSHVGHIQINTTSSPMKPATVVATKQRSTKFIVGLRSGESTQSWRRSWRIASRRAPVDSSAVSLRGSDDMEPKRARAMEAANPAGDICSLQVCRSGHQCDADTSPWRGGTLFQFRFARKREPCGSFRFARNLIP